jgi:hypothetical protein
MKRVILALMGLFCAVGLCMAQNWQARHQIGTATQEMMVDGMSAAHSRIPIGSKAKVTNPANGLEIEVTITRQIPESPNRIIDLSASAARALDISSGGPVIVASLGQQVPSAPESPAGPSEIEVQTGQQPFHITINNYIINPDKSVLSENRQEYPAPAELPAPQPITQSYLAEVPVSPPAVQPAAQPPAPPAVQPATPPPAPPAVQPTAPPPAQPVAQPAAQPPAQQQAAQPVAQPPVQPKAPSDKPSMFTSPPIYDPQIIPGLPNPNTDKVYRLLVGTYPGVDSAFRISQQLQAAGFDVDQEQAGNMCKVFAAGIPASRVYYAAKRLGAIGFQQIWIQE